MKWHVAEDASCQTHLLYYELNIDLSLYFALHIFVIDFGLIMFSLRFFSVYTGMEENSWPQFQSTTILVRTIFERIKSIRARSAINISIDVLSMYGNLYGHEWYVNKNVTSILLVQQNNINNTFNILHWVRSGRHYSRYI